VEESSLEKRAVNPLLEKGQFILAFGVVGMMLYIAGLPMFLLFFVGALAFLIWKIFSVESKYETRRIFEFYLSANEVLRDDGRKWYGFEINEAIQRGESIVKSMSVAPPLVHYGLGDLYNKIGDKSSAVKHLSLAIEEMDELSVAYPDRDLREYVCMLRKIERSPAEAPLTSSAIRSLERARKNRGKSLLEKNRAELENVVEQLPELDKAPGSIIDDSHESNSEDLRPQEVDSFALKRRRRAAISSSIARKADQDTVGKQGDGPAYASDRKSISEVLHDIYDGTA